MSLICNNRYSIVFLITEFLRISRILLGMSYRLCIPNVSALITAQSFVMNTHLLYVTFMTHTPVFPFHIPPLPKPQHPKPFRTHPLIRPC